MAYLHVHAFGHVEHQLDDRSTLAVHQSFGEQVDEFLGFMQAADYSVGVECEGFHELESVDTAVEGVLLPWNLAVSLGAYDELEVGQVVLGDEHARAVLSC